MRNLFRLFCNDNRGNIIIVSSVAIPMLLVATGLAVDLNRYLKSADYVQSAVDQAAIAAVAVDGQDRIEVATRFFNASLTEEVRQSVELKDIDVVEKITDGEGLSVTVTADVLLTNQFGAFVGYDTLDITRSGEASRAVENVEVAISFASSGTMCSKKTRITNPGELVEGDTLLQLTPDPACENFEAVKTGIREFVDIIEGNSTVADLKIGLVPYNSKVRMPDTNNIPPSLSVNEPSDYYRDVSDVEPLSPVLPLTSDMAAVKRAIADLRQTETGIAWSRSDLGSHVAGLMLDKRNHSYFGGDAPSEPEDAMTQKIIIMMTDGANIGCCFTNWPLNNFDKQYVYFYEPYNNQQLEICRVLKEEQNVKIFSILFDVKETDPGGEQINNIYARCASGAYEERGVENDANANLRCDKKSFCFNVKDQEELKAAYRQIAQTFYKPRITK